MCVRTVQLETCTVARLYTTEKDANKWGFANAGAVALTRLEETYTIRLYDLKVRGSPLLRASHRSCDCVRSGT